MFCLSHNRLTTKVLLFLCSAIILISLSACTNISNTPRPLTPVTLQLAWTHQVQFAGFYAAVQKGYYADEGLAVTFIEGGAYVDKISPVITGTAQFGIASPDELILTRADGKPVKAVATILRRSPVVFISLAEKGITRPQDFSGKTIRTAANVQASLFSMMNKIGVTQDQYSIVDTPSDVALFATGDIPVWGVYINSFVVSVQQAGYKINLIYPDDYGVHFSSDSIFSTDEVIANDPDLVLRFVRASLKGWSYAVENPNEIPPIVKNYASNADSKLDLIKMNTTIPLVNTGEDHIGWMKPEVWTFTENSLREYKVLNKPVDVTQVYTMQFLDEIYK
jgi:NitT/TauT family transport system substrate-binding protein